MAENLIFIGSLNRGLPAARRGPGLAVYAFDEATLKATKLAEATDVDNPSFLSVSRDGSRIYANSEVESWPEGTVSAYRFDRAAGRLSHINKQPTLGNSPVHNAITRDGSKLLVANYGAHAGGGPDKAVAAFGIGPDGALTPPLGSAAQSGHGPDAQRQERSHPHSVNETVPGNVAIVADLGTDRLVSYRIAPDGPLTLLADFALAPGSGLW
jgi:6-phosphogluconolactonase